MRGADTSRLDLTPQSAGLFAISLGLATSMPDDHEMLKHGMVMYDALYAWCRSLTARPTTGRRRCEDAMTTPPRSAASPAAARTRLMLEGPIVPTLLRLAAPNLVVNVVLIAVTTSVDAHFIGRLGLDALAGLALVFPLLMLMQQMANMAMGGAIAAAIARAIGAGRREDAASLVVHALSIAAGAAALFSAVFLLGGPAIYAVLGGRGPILAAALEYSNVIFAGALRLLAARRAHQRRAGDRAGRHPGLRLCRRRSAAYRAGAAARCSAWGRFPRSASPARASPP